MSVSRRIAFAVVISWLSRSISILSGLFLMPILFRYMGKEELGVWFLLGNSQAFLGLLGLGITPTLTRHISFAKGKTGLTSVTEFTEESKRDIGDLVVTGRIILQVLAVLVFFIAWASGYGLINQLHLKEVSPHIVFWSWTLMCASYAIGVWVSYLNCWLAGIGYVGWDGVIGTILSLLTIMANIIAVLLGGGILGLAFVSVVSSLLGRFILLGFLRWRTPDLLKIKGKWNTNYAKALIKPSLLWWLTDLGAFLILRTDAYFIGFFKGAAQLPKYQAAYSLVSNPYQIALAFASASPVFISQAWQAGDWQTIHKLTFRNAKLGLSIMAASVSFILMAGQEFMNIWLGQGNFIGYPVIIVFCIMLTLEAQHVILVISSRATEDEKYAPWALTAGFLNVIFTWYLIKPFGLLGVAMGTMFAQLLTNNWYAVYRPLIRLNIRFREYVHQVLVLWALTLLSCLILTWLTKQTLISYGISSDWSILLASAVVCSVVFCISFWCGILEKRQQKLIQAKLQTYLPFIR
jgi:O-antigen/teichoic acid export membrane protein